jgi:hypothetical protein
LSSLLSINMSLQGYSEQKKILFRSVPPWFFFMGWVPVLDRWSHLRLWQRPVHGDSINSPPCAAGF